jgi:hypothetical protein
VIIAHDSVSLYISALMRTSPTSMLPFASQSTGTTCCIAAQPVATQRNPLHRIAVLTRGVLTAYSRRTLRVVGHSQAYVRGTLGSHLHAAHCGGGGVGAVRGDGDDAHVTATGKARISTACTIEAKEYMSDSEGQDNAGAWWYGGVNVWWYGGVVRWYSVNEWCGVVWYGMVW